MRSSLPPRGRRGDRGPGWPVAQRQQGEQRPGAGVGGAPGQDPPERLPEDPEHHGHHEGQDQGGAHRLRRQVDTSRDDGQHDSQDDRRGQTLVRHDGGASPQQGGDPARLPGLQARDHVVQALRRPAAGQQGEVGQAEPEHQPQGPGHPGAHRASGDERDRPAAVRRPQQHGQQRVEDHRARRTADRIDISGQDQAEALAEPPHRDRPADRGGQRRPDRRPPGDAQAQQQLDGGEDRVEQDEVMLDQGGVPGDRAGDDPGVAGRRLGQHRAEPLGEHEPLVLQDAVQQPYRGQGQLQQPPGVGRSPGGTGFGAQPASPGQTRCPGGDVTHPVSPRQPPPGHRFRAAVIRRIRSWIGRHNRPQNTPDKIINAVSGPLQAVQEQRILPRSGLANPQLNGHPMIFLNVAVNPGVVLDKPGEGIA